jgi:uncharacterized repeat protein (TIGR01451 family)
VVVTPVPVPPTVVPVATPLPVKARIRVTKKGPAAVRAGATARFRIRVANDGAGVARGVRVVDVLPAGFTLVRAGSPGVRLSAGRPAWTIARIRPGHSRTVYIQVRTTADARGTRCNRVRVTAPGVSTEGARACVRVSAAPPRVRVIAVTG